MKIKAKPLSSNFRIDGFGFRNFGIKKISRLFIASFITFVQFSILTALHAQHQQNYVFEQIFLEEGLSQSIVQCICQDRQGFMWFGTEDGLNQYDGYEFTILRNDPDDTNSISYNNITALLEDHSGILWIGTFYGGLNRYDPTIKKIKRIKNEPANPNSLSHNNINVIFEDHSRNLWIGTDNGLNKLILDSAAPSFMRFQHDPEDSGSLSNDVIRAIHEDSAGHLWIGTENGLNMLDSNSVNKPTFIRFYNDPENQNSLSSNSIYSILEDRAGTLWIGTKGGGLNKFQPQLQRFTRYLHDPFNPRSLSHNEVYEIHEDRTGILWIGTNGGGLCIFERNSETFIRFQNDEFDPNTISYNEIRAIYEDRAGLIWIGTYGGGVEKIDKSKQQFKLYQTDPDDPNSLNHSIIWSIYEDSDTNLWIGTHGGGVNKLNRNTGQWTHYQHDPANPNSLSHDIVRVIYPDIAGNLWFGTHGGGINKFDPQTEKFTRFLHAPGDPESLIHDEIRAIYQDQQGHIWIGTYGAGLDKLVTYADSKRAPKFVHYRHNPDNANSISNDFVRVICEDRSGNFWIGTEGGGLNKMDRNSGTFTRFQANPTDSTSLNNDYIFSIYEDGDGNLWLGTWGGGINKFDLKTEQFSRYTQIDGLPNDAVYGILEDDEGNLWISTNKGISKFNPETESFKNYSAEDGLQSNEFNAGSFYKSESGELFFGGIAGFNAFYPKDIVDNPFIPPVVITAFTKLNKEVHFKKPIFQINEILLSYRDYVFAFQFSALDFTAPEKNMYAYKMEGLDTDWVYTDSKKRFANYTTLPPGTYVFRVKGSNNDGVWNDKGTSIKIRITPPMWQTWWFKLIAALLIFGLIIFLYMRRLNNIRIKTELRAARSAQMSIMPQSDPQVPGFDISGICIPANTVGGDFFDYFWLNSGKSKFGIAVGDVSGKAMKSAMTAVMTSGMLVANAELGFNSIRDFMSGLNNPIFEKTDRQMFIALCLVSLDVQSKELVFSNAGLIEPILKRGNSVQFVKSIGSKYPLGLIQHNSYKEKSVQLKTGDTIFFITDGIPEAQNLSRKQYGERKITNLLQKIDTAALSAKDIKVEMIKDVKHFSGKAPQHDDMTVVVVKCL